ncbi:hypothetical protein [Rouxiella chamberiensis]|uniref:Uncharacterized protein n=1 Tax=Rouxiella chamberiensis TaxID=1513468 RepID=A0ABY7HKG6_9GAMM|nr:hypothetical protein [Rouxiella chamberiensis]WAS99649.1 hypothetical protein O1V66_10820 [Rouxiella chamberiensis]
MSDKPDDIKTKADEVHVSDGLAELHKVAEQLTPEELNELADAARKAAEEAKKHPQP